MDEANDLQVWLPHLSQARLLDYRSSSFGGRTRINRTTRPTAGKLASEKFDGELDGSAYERMARQASDRSPVNCEVSSQEVFLRRIRAYSFESTRQTNRGSQE